MGGRGRRGPARMRDKYGEREPGRREDSRGRLSRAAPRTATGGAGALRSLLLQPGFLLTHTHTHTHTFTLAHVHRHTRTYTLRLSPHFSADTHILHADHPLRSTMAESHLQSSLITASQFFEIWLHFDADGSGYLEGKELQSLIQELQQARKKAGLELSPEMKTFVDQYGQRDDGKIGIVELAHVLPTEENFLLLFRCQQLKSCEEFMKTWRKYDTDHSGFIETEELKNFLKDLLEKANKTVDDTKLAEYTDLMLKLFDSNNDGKLELTEMARLLPVQENFLLKFQGVKMCGKEFNKAFELYDQDGNGYIDENELDALLKDLCEKNKQDLDINNIPTYKKSIMALSDGGKLYRTDLALILSAGDN